MINAVFLIGITLLPAFILCMGFKFLPKEKWQIIGALPMKRMEDGSWKGMNLTYYGFFNAFACGYAVLLVFVFLGAVYVPPMVVLFFIVFLLSICLPASKITARWVEKKSNTLTIAGASFVGFLIIPWILKLTQIILAHYFGIHLSGITVLSALSIAYVYGESLGRLACISFGCCYGKKITEVPRILQWFFQDLCFVFSGKNKKIAYAHGLDGLEVFPIQAITALIYLIIGTIGSIFYLKGHFSTAFLTTVIFSQVWRFLSEFLRADYRGTWRISAYQLISLAIGLFAIPVSFLFSEAIVLLPKVLHGIKILWDPMVILGIQGVFFTTFFITGRSRVTYARMWFFIAWSKV